MAPIRVWLGTVVAASIGCVATQVEPTVPAANSPFEPPSVESHPPPLLRDNGKCWTDTGYRKGEPAPVCITRLEAWAVECGTAKVFLDMRHAAARDGVSLRIVSGFRSMKEQQVLHACHKKGKCPLAARPGYSHHQDGLALDLNAKDRGVYDWLERNATAFGFRRTVPSEPWHWERYEGVINVQSLCQS